MTARLSEAKSRSDPSLKISGFRAAVSLLVPCGCERLSALCEFVQEVVLCDIESSRTYDCGSSGR